MNDARINERIRVPEVRLVGPAGEQVGIVRVEDALRLAQEANLDLVEVAPNERPPVAKLMDYGKFKYESAVKAREARRNQAHTDVKEMRFRLKIDDHDYETKKGHVVRFLNQGDKVKITIMFRGREQSRPEMGRKLLMRLAEDVADLSVVENAPTQEGRNMSLVLGPLKRKAEAQAEARRARKDREAEEKSAKAKSTVSVESEAKGKQQAADTVRGPVFDEDDKSSSSRPASKKKAPKVEPAVENAAPKSVPATKTASKKLAEAKAPTTKAASASKAPAKKPAAKKLEAKVPAKKMTKNTKTSGT